MAYVTSLEEPKDGKEAKYYRSLDYHFLLPQCYKLKTLVGGFENGYYQAEKKGCHDDPKGRENQVWPCPKHMSVLLLGTLLVLQIMMGSGTQSEGPTMSLEICMT